LAFAAAFTAFAGRFGFGAGLALFALLARAAGLAVAFLLAADFFPCTFAIVLSPRVT
jgi:hypothetical protein